MTHAGQLALFLITGENPDGRIAASELTGPDGKWLMAPVYGYDHHEETIYGIKR